MLDLSRNQGFKNTQNDFNRQKWIILLNFSLFHLSESGRSRRTVWRVVTLARCLTASCLLSLLFWSFTLSHWSLQDEHGLKRHPCVHTWLTTQTVCHNHQHFLSSLYPELTTPLFQHFLLLPAKRAAQRLALIRGLTRRRVLQEVSRRWRGASAGELSEETQIRVAQRPGESVQPGSQRQLQTHVRTKPDLSD